MSLVLKRVKRPRELKWPQAGAMLYGDWGTSKAYVLGIAFALAGHASWFFLGLMAALTAVVGGCYMIICRIYPDGGGVYSSAKHKSQLLAVIGAFLLIADYVITASLSALDAFHYFNFPHPELWAIGSILAIGALNWYGPSKGGNAAFAIAISASICAFVLFLSTIPSLSQVQLSWPDKNWPHNWSIFVGIVLALSGVESIANMTGIMAEPVETTSRKAIVPVLLEVCVLTFLLGIAMNAIPGLTDHTEDMLRALGNYYIGPWYGALISVVFGFLLLSAANTAISALVSIQFAMSKDRELPAAFSKLNRHGMPGLALIVACLIPILVLSVERDLVRLAALYAIGVVGAITINLGACALNFEVALKKHERFFLGLAALVLLGIEITIAIQKHNALVFASSILGAGLVLRFIAQRVLPVSVPGMVPTAAVLTVSEAREIVPLYQSSSLVALKVLNVHLLEEAALRAKAMGENAIYVNYVDVAPETAELPSEMEPSHESLEILAKAEKEMERYGVTAIPVWQLGEDAGKTIAHAARELDVKTVLIGTTKRSALANLLSGNVLRSLTHHLPKECHLVISG